MCLHGNFAGLMVAVTLIEREDRTWDGRANGYVIDTDFSKITNRCWIATEFTTTPIDNERRS